MEYGFFELLKLIGALGFFIFGMKVMSESIQKVAGDKLRSVMSLITSNRLSGVFTGFFTTAIIQSSSATTVMVVSFVNAGLLKLREAIGVIMGANIGTTVTGILIIVFGFSKFSISHYTLPIIAFGFPLMFMKKTSLKYWGEFMIGFALLFMGLSALKGAVPDLKSNPEILAWISSIENLGFLAIILSVLIGTLLTVIVQSSSAAMAITLIMVDNGWIPYEMACAIVLGENIGTTITANLAALVGNVHAKRAALAHFMFNVFGVVWMLVIFYFYIGAIDSFMISIGEGSPLVDIPAVKWGLTYFHISFNIINTAIMIWFVPQIETLVTKMIKFKDEEDQEFHLDYIGTNLMRTAELSLLEVRKELSKYCKLLIKMNQLVLKVVESDDKKEQEELAQKIYEYEQRTDDMELEINDYLVKVAEGRLSSSTSNEIHSMLNMTKDLERIGDIQERMARDLKRRSKHDLKYNERQLENTRKMFGVVDEAFDIMKSNLAMDYSDVSDKTAREKEDEINALTKELNKKHIKNIDEPNYDVKTGIIYRDVIFACEKIGDHIINVTESVVGE
ncbi:MAG: Na/Pi cotransporter family protein [Reichenbachiella sp.]